MANLLLRFSRKELEMRDEFSFAIPHSIYRVNRSLGTSEANLNPRLLNLLNRFAKIFARCLRCRPPQLC
jgi:hypothetical protein